MCVCGGSGAGVKACYQGSGHRWWLWMVTEEMRETTQARDEKREQMQDSRSQFSSFAQTEKLIRLKKKRKGKKK